MNLTVNTDWKENDLPTEEALYFNIYRKQEFSLFKKELFKLKNEIFFHKQTAIFLCIGSDRATGDCFGPLVGEALLHAREKKARLFQSPKVYGTLDKPIHAINLENTIRQIYHRYQNPYVFAIDASLGIKNHIGFITLGAGPLFPGIGVKKELPEIGDAAITGIVNENNDKGQHTLQTTRLSVVYHLANFVSRGIIECFFV
ncbi:MAG: spore protease YyaC [Lachnospiraceae bacterium]|nr:spore protease YyaC [Lachnospiraceae bacterium]